MGAGFYRSRTNRGSSVSQPILKAGWIIVIWFWKNTFLLFGKLFFFFVSKPALFPFLLGNYFLRLLLAVLSSTVWLPEQFFFILNQQQPDRLMRFNCEISSWPIGLTSIFIEIRRYKALPTFFFSPQLCIPIFWGHLLWSLRFHKSDFHCIYNEFSPPCPFQNPLCAAFLSFFLERLSAASLVRFWKLLILQMVSRPTCDRFSVFQWFSVWLPENQILLQAIFSAYRSLWGSWTLVLVWLYYTPSVL